MLELDLERPCEELYNFDKFLKKIPDGCTEDLRIHLNGGGGYAEEMSMYLVFLTGTRETYLLSVNMK